MNRRNFLLAGTAGLFVFSHMLPAFAANPAETFVSDNIQRGFDILNDASLSAADRKVRFASFATSLTDVRRVALFMLGRYSTGASPADIDAYVAAYQDYILAVYQSYFARYAGQSLRVIDSRARTPNDYVVRTQVTGGTSQPLQIEFRVATDGAKPVLLDISVEGLWLALMQREEFNAVLALSNGDLKALIAHLRTTTQRY